MCQAAQTAKRTPVYAETCARLSQRRGKKIATTAIAREFLTRVYHLLREAEAARASKEGSTPA
ncbi:hypothetical protein KE639_05673 [Streptomyces sp. V17-9]|nr:hypothetical protein KE639_05673 [Streptomyces sp. V17-9]